MASDIAVKDVAPRFESERPNLGLTVFNDKSHLILSTLDNETVLLKAIERVLKSNLSGCNLVVVSIKVLSVITDYPEGAIGYWLHRRRLSPTPPTGRSQ